MKDEYSVELLEARDLLFARLLQYKAFKESGRTTQLALRGGVRADPAAGGLDPAVTTALPPLKWTLTPEQFAQLAVVALDPERRAGRGQRGARTRCRGARRGRGGDHGRDPQGRPGPYFATLISDADSVVIVVRFLSAILEMFRDRVVPDPSRTGARTLLVRWDGPDDWTSEGLNSEYTGAEIPLEGTSVNEDHGAGE